MFNYTFFSYFFCFSFSSIHCIVCRNRRRRFFFPFLFFSIAFHVDKRDRHLLCSLFVLSTLRYVNLNVLEGTHKSNKVMWMFCCLRNAFVATVFKWSVFFNFFCAFFIRSHLHLVDVEMCVVQKCVCISTKYSYRLLSVNKLDSNNIRSWDSCKSVISTWLKTNFFVCKIVKCKPCIWLYEFVVLNKKKKQFYWQWPDVVCEIGFVSMPKWNQFFFLQFYFASTQSRRTSDGSNEIFFFIFIEALCKHKQTECNVIHISSFTVNSFHYFFHFSVIFFNGSLSDIGEFAFRPLLRRSKTLSVKWREK